MAEEVVATTSQWIRVARKRWGNRTYLIEGDGQYAVLAHCGLLSVVLHQTMEDAERAKTRIDQTACGGRCHKDHEIINLAGRRSRRIK
jgi:hypothetical protein